MAGCGARQTRAWLGGATLVIAAVVVVSLHAVTVGSESVAGTAGPDSSALAELTFPIRHATVDTDAAGNWWVNLDDGTTSAQRQLVPASPGGGPYTVRATDDCMCGPITITVRPDLAVLATGTWMGRDCTFTAGTTKSASIHCT